MDRINNLLKALIGILLLVSFVITFSSCNKHDDSHTDISQKNSEESYEDKTNEKIAHDWNSIKGEVERDEKALDKDLKEIEEKASTASKKINAEIHQSVEKIKSDKNKVKLDSMKPEFKEEWNSFKRNAHNTIDSLKRELK